MDMKSYASRMKESGTSLRNGDSVLISKVKVKDKSIELQLGGGGYGTFGDDTDTSVRGRASGAGPTAGYDGVQ